MGNKPKTLHKRAKDLFDANRLNDALSIYKELCSLNKKDIQAWHMAGAIAGMTGENAFAISCCKTVIALNPNNHAPYLNLANVLMASGNFQEALQSFKQALQIKPEDPQTLTNMAGLFSLQGKLEFAIDCLKNAIRSDPEYPEAYNNLGNLYRDTGRLEDAESCFQQALKIKPDYVDALCNLGALLSDQLKFTEAKIFYDKALQYTPGNISALRNIGDIYQSTGEFEQARQSYENILRQSPSDIDTLSSLATLYERCGEKERALELLTPLINSNQYNVNAAITYARLCSNQSNAESGIQVLSNMLNKPVGQNRIIDIHFSLGELYDHSGQYNRAFDYFKTANDMDAARQSTMNHTTSLAPVAEFFNKECLNHLPQSTCRSELPVFIVGMPRSGTSLVEQILASHPLVAAGGERGDIFSIIGSLNSATKQEKAFPHSLQSISQGALNVVAIQHLEQIKSIAGECIRFTDKTPLHGIHLGLISRLFPKSRIIICNRNALDTCLSVYFHRFNAFHSYANKLDSLGNFYREYQALMNHWVEILDIEILSVQYEDLVSEPEQHIRRIIRFCGLDWDSRCLLFHENKRTANTPSYDQVRKPMYTKSVNRWKHYKEHLEPLRAALDK